MSRCDEAIAAGEADHAFAMLSRFDHLILAVSGGPDSLALLYLVDEWIKRHRPLTPALSTSWRSHASHDGGEGDVRNVPVVSVATVDHGLREESAREAEIVAGHCRTLGLMHATLRWDGAKPARGIPNAAREARYALLEAHARTVGVGGSVAVVTAHHQDDQAETVFMRLARGGGVDALAAMRAERLLIETSPVCLVRPLLGFSKAQLIATLSAHGVSWLDDPTNSNTKFERARVRQTLEASGLDAAALAATARRMQDAREGLNYAAQRFKETLALSYNGGIFASFDRPAFDAGPVVLRRIIIAGLIGNFGGSTPKPEVSEIEALTTRIGSCGETTMLTLGGTMVSAGQRVVRLWREPGRIRGVDVNLTPGRPQLWDERFWVSFLGAGGTDVTVRPLGLDGLGTIAEQIADEPRLPVEAVVGLPAFWVDATLLAVPQLAVTTDAGKRDCALKFSSEPVVS